MKKTLFIIGLGAIFACSDPSGENKETFTVVEKFYGEKIDNNNSRIVLALKPHLSPIKAAVIPLKRNNDQLVERAKSIKKILQQIGVGRIILENTGNIGKNYRRHDEIGTPLCITVDFETLESNSVTIRDRDSMQQKRLSTEELKEYFKNYFD